MVVLGVVLWWRARPVLLLSHHLVNLEDKGQERVG